MNGLPPRRCWLERPVFRCITAPHAMLSHAMLPHAMLQFAMLPIVMLTIAFLVGAESLAADETDRQIEFFESNVRPILVEHCYQCHSVKAEDIEAGLLLDSKWGWETGGDSGPAVVPGEVDNSLLVEAIRYQEDVVSGMPPKSKLADREIALLEQWIAMGAPDPRPKATPGSDDGASAFDLQRRVAQHWSWRPISTPQPPSVQRRDWPRNDVDRFILAKLENVGLRPAADAERRTWLRRVCFDLIGLPPTPAQIEQFLADPSADARRSIVSRLLDSPQFGEKWARHWMDLVRYADTYGHEFDYELKYAHEYRDYLIRAFNADVPYDQLVREHIAGDLIAEPRRNPATKWNESIIGTGFWYLHEATHSPTDVTGNEANIIDNQIDVFGKTFLGLTVACARCHDHKFDAISTADYYALSAYLQSSCRQEVPLDEDFEIASTTDSIDRLRRDAAESLGNMRAEAVVNLRPGAYYETAKRLTDRATSSETTTTVPNDWIDDAAAERNLDPQLLDRWVLAHDRVRWNWARWNRPESDEDKIPTSILFEDFNEGELPEGWSTTGTAFRSIGGSLQLTTEGRIATPGTIDSGIAGRRQVGILRSPTFELATNQIHLRIKSTADITVRVIIDNYQMAHFNPLLFKGTFLNGEQTDTGGRWVWKSLQRDLRKYLGHRVYLEIIDQGDGAIAVDEIRFSDSPVPVLSPVAADRHASSINHAWREGAGDLRQGKPNALIASMLDADLLSLQQLHPAADASISQARQLAGQLPLPRFAIAMAQGTPEDARIHIRGSHTSLGEQVPGRMLEALGGEKGTRLDLANQIACADNPLTARVIVNRLWHHLFGRGIVASVDDFGPQGEMPSHPDLLDWLAQDLIQHDWSLKHVIEQLVLSRTYLQSSVAHSSLSDHQIDQVDPTNQLLHRMRVRRLPAESIRDAMLLVSGRLDTTPFGPGVATHRTPFMSGRGARPSGPLDGDGRRSIYQSVYRNFLNPFMLTFDAPSPFGPNGRRSQSNVPAQILTLMNDPFVVQQSQFWVDSVLQDSVSSDRQRIAQMITRAHGTQATEEQLAKFERFLSDQSDLYGRQDRRVWADLAHILFTMKAFYFLR